MAAGKIAPEEAATAVAKTLDLDHTLVDLERPQRNGFPEMIYGAGKTPQQLVELFRRMSPLGSVLATRVSPEAAAAVVAALPEVAWNACARTLSYSTAAADGLGSVGIITAGTSDLAVAEEARITCEFLGCRPLLFQDVGVAGLHRLVSRLEEIRRLQVLIIIAGMEAALASVVGGLVAAPVIAVPTSAGCGTGAGGIAALLGMLNCCASGVTVVNIDNGFGAACAARRILAGT